MTDIRKSMRQVLEEINSSEIEKLQELALDENTDAGRYEKAEKSVCHLVFSRKFLIEVAAWKIQTQTNPTQWPCQSKFLCNKIVWYMGQKQIPTLPLKSE